MTQLDSNHNMSQLVEQFGFDLSEEFIENYRAMLEEMELMVIELKEPERYTPNIQQIFRIFHNLKSATGYLKLYKIHHFCIFVEDQLETARELEGPANDAFIDWLLATYDQLKHWLDDLECERDLGVFEHNIMKIPASFTAEAPSER